MNLTYWLEPEMDEADNIGPTSDLVEEDDTYHRPACGGQEIIDDGFGWRGNVGCPGCESCIVHNDE